MAKSPAWQRKAGKNPSGGLNAKGRASYKGGTLKAPVTQKTLKVRQKLEENRFVQECVA